MAEVYINETGLAANLNGDPIQLLENDVQSFSLHVIWASSLAGTLTVEASNDPNAESDPSGVDWVDISSRFTTIPTISGTSGNGMIDATLGGFAFVRLVFTHSSDGDLTVYKHAMKRRNVR